MKSMYIVNCFYDTLQCSLGCNLLETHVSDITSKYPLRMHTHKWTRETRMALSYKTYPCDYLADFLTNAEHAPRHKYNASLTLQLVFNTPHKSMNLSHHRWKQPTVKICRNSTHVHTSRNCELNAFWKRLLRGLLRSLWSDALFQLRYQKHASLEAIFLMWKSICFGSLAIAEKG